MSICVQCIRSLRYKIARKCAFAIEYLNFPIYKGGNWKFCKLPSIYRQFYLSQVLSSEQATEKFNLNLLEGVKRDFGGLRKDFYKRMKFKVQQTVKTLDLNAKKSFTIIMPFARLFRPDLKALEGILFRIIIIYSLFNSFFAFSWFPISISIKFPMSKILV